MALLARALRLDRAALVIATPDGRELRPLAAHGPVGSADWEDGTPRSSRWSAVLPLERGSARGFLLLDRADRTPLSEQDRRLATSAVGASALAEPFDEGRGAQTARDRLAHADRLAAIGTLAAGLAHEIRNPLVSVRTFIQLLPERLDDEEFRTSFRALALDEIERICGLINDLLAFARPTPGEREPTDVVEVVTQTIRLLDAEARKHNVRLVYEAAERSPRVVADEAQLKQVMLNVVLNAMQACSSGGHVVVSTRGERETARSWCTIEVADTGHGIADRDVAHIFDPFYTTKDLGSGLGLFIARRIVDDHAGTIHAAPRRGGGCVFTIRLPAHPEEHDEHAG
jgi:signal transduction histidine kinase